MEVYVVLFVSLVVIFVVLYFIYGNRNQNAREKNVRFNIENNKIIHIDQNNPVTRQIPNQPAKMQEEIRFKFSNDYNVNKNQYGTPELKKMYEEARETVPEDKVRCYWNGRKQIEQLPYANPIRCSLLDESNE